MLQGLRLYELIIIIAGAVLLLALIFALIWFVIKNRKLTTLIPFFIFPMVMIGWPAINSISYDKGKLEIKKQAEVLDNNPADTTARKELEKSLADFSTSRSENDPQALTNLSHAYYALGKYDSAMIFSDKALGLEPGKEETMKLRANILQQIQVKKDFQQNIQLLNNNLKTIESGAAAPKTEAVQNVASILSGTEVPVYADEKACLTIAKGLAAVDKKEKSLEIINKILEKNPASAEALQVKKEIEMKPTPVTPVPFTKTIDTKKFNNAVIIRKP
jgi:tetratricopeptide (TPR) repeat protein